MPNTTTVTTLYIRSLFQALQSFGLAETSIFQILNITPDEISSPDNRITITRLGNMWQQAIATTKEPLLGLYAGSHVTPADYGIIGHMSLAAETLEDALRTGIEYEHLINDSFHTELIQGDRVVYNRVECDDLDPEILAPLIEFDFATLINFAISAAAKPFQGDVKPIEVHFKHKAQGDIARYEQILQAPILFEQPYNQVLITNSVLELPTRSPDPSILTMIMGRMSQMDELYVTHCQSFSKEVSDFISANISKGFACVEDIANSFNISPSTVKRRLSKEGTSYTEIGSKMKKEIALSLLREGTSIFDIALILGFSEASAFTRAFKQWTGKSPSDCRPDYSGSKSEQAR